MTTYNPNQRVAKFLQDQGVLGSVVLDAFNTIDPLSCYFGSDCNPDEYLGYAKRFIESLKREEMYFNTSRRNRAWPQFIRELVSRSFGAVQLAEGVWIREGAIEEIASRIQEVVTPETKLD